MSSSSSVTLGQATNASESSLARALYWFSIWHGRRISTTTPQECQGVAKNEAYEVRCTPSGVVVDYQSGTDGDCSVLFMRHTYSGETSIRERTVPFQSLSASALCLPGHPITSRIEFALFPIQGPISTPISEAAVESALDYRRRSGAESCALRIPNVHLGDPFVHIYVLCQGVLSVIWELPIQSGKVASYSHWSYSRTRGTLPKGATTRLSQHELWYKLLKPVNANPALRQ